MPKRKKQAPILVVDSHLRQLAEILGPGSASAAAFNELEQRRASGQDVFCYDVGRSFIVGPRMHADPASGDKTAIIAS